MGRVLEVKAPTLASRPLPGLSSRLSTISFGDPGHQFENHWSISLSLFLQLLKKGVEMEARGIRFPCHRGIVKMKYGNVRQS